MSACGCSGSESSGEQGQVGGLSPLMARALKVVSPPDAFLQKEAGARSIALPCFSFNKKGALVKTMSRKHSAGGQLPPTGIRMSGEAPCFHAAAALVRIVACLVSSVDAKYGSFMLLLVLFDVVVLLERGHDDCRHAPPARHVLGLSNIIVLPRSAASYERLNHVLLTHATPCALARGC